MLSPTLIAHEIEPLLVLYPEAGHNGATLVLLAEQWQDLLADDGVNEAEFVWAMRRAKKHCRFFPKIADILEGVRAYREHPPPAATVDARHRLPEESVVPLTAEERARNVKKIAVLMAQAAHQISPEEAADELRAIAEGTA